MGIIDGFVYAGTGVMSLLYMFILPDDKNPLVAGKGLDMLRAAGIDAEVSEDDCGAAGLNAGFCRRMAGGRPLVRLKVAATLETSEAGARRYRCEDASVPIARLDIPCGLRAKDTHADAVCASRRYLYDHMDDVGKRAFADAFVACNIGSLLPSNATETP